MFILFLCIFKWNDLEAWGAPQAERRLSVQISRVFDGSSFLIGNGLRGALIGVAAPSLHAKGGKESFAFLKKLLEGKTVKVEIDEQLVDSFGQARYYVFLPDGTFVNALVLLRGYARAVIKHPNIRRRDELLKAENLAKTFKRGIWGDEFRDPDAKDRPPDFDRPYTIYPRNRRYY